MAMTRHTINEAKSKIGKSAKLFLNDLSRLDIVSLHVLTKEKETCEIAKLCTLLEKSRSE